MNGSLELGDDGKSTEPFDAPQTIRMRMHRFCEGDGSVASTLFSFASISFVLISVLGLVFGSIHDFQVSKIQAKILPSAGNKCQKTKRGFGYFSFADKCIRGVY